MALYTSSQFASASATGADWREASKSVLEQLQEAKPGTGKFNLGFIYVSDHLVKDATNIINLFKSVLEIPQWCGAVGVGVCGVGQEHIDQPAISAMIGAFEPKDFCVFPAFTLDPATQDKTLAPWLEQNDPMLMVVHGDPLAEEDPAYTIKKLGDFSHAFLMGGLSSSRHEQIQFAGGRPQKNGVSGVAFSQNVPVATSLSQGCEPIGEIHTITRSEEHIIHELDGRPVTEIFEEGVRALTIKKTERDPDAIRVPEEALSDPNLIPDEFQRLFDGEISIAFPVSGTDQKDYLVRNIIGIDEHESLLVSQRVVNGETLRFVYRDQESIRQDLSKTLLDLRERVIRDTGTFAPKGALYISCAARAFYGTGNPGQSEMKLVREIIGDVPLTGFYAGGEICNARLYGYTGVLTLFL